MFEPPSLKFGEVDLAPRVEELCGFKKRSLSEHGPAKKIEITKNLIVVHPFLPREIVSGFIADLKRIARNYFKIKLPYIYRWIYNDELDDEAKRSLYNRYKRFRSRIEGAIVIFEKRDSRYFFFKELFQDIPTQMIRKKTIESKFNLSPGRIGRYWSKILNTCSGLLTKMRARLWILWKPLAHDCYAGIDVGEGGIFCHFYIYDKYCRNNWIADIFG